MATHTETSLPRRRSRLLHFGFYLDLPLVVHRLNGAFDPDLEAGTQVEVPTHLCGVVARRVDDTLGHEAEVDFANADLLDAWLFVIGHQMRRHEGSDENSWGVGSDNQRGHPLSVKFLRSATTREISCALFQHNGHVRK